MNTARKSGKIPRTQELYAYRTHRGYEIKLVDIPAWRLAELTPLPVPARLTKPHSLVAALQQRSQPMGLTKSIQGRALRIIQALIIATESQGHKTALGTTQGAPPTPPSPQRTTALHHHRPRRKRRIPRPSRTGPQRTHPHRQGTRRRQEALMDAHRPLRLHPLKPPALHPLRRQPASCERMGRCPRQATRRPTRRNRTRSRPPRQSRRTQTACRPAGQGSPAEALGNRHGGSAHRIRLRLSRQAPRRTSRRLAPDQAPDRIRHSSTRPLRIAATRTGKN